MKQFFLNRFVISSGALLFVAAVTVSALHSSVQSAACRCPLIYAPVVCDHNRTYSNQCLADCHNAKNCVPTGGAIASN